MHPGILSGEGGMREVAAYLLDHKGMAGVPATGFVYSWSDSFQNTLPEAECGTANARSTPHLTSSRRMLKQGSLQEFVRADGNRDGWGWPKFSTFEVQKIAVLDLRILNLDRNEENTLVQFSDGGKQCRLVPIDHGACLPELYNTVEAVNLEWRSSPQAKQPVEPQLKEYIAQLDVERDVHLLRNVLNFKDTCVRMFRLAHVLLKRGVAAGMTLLDVSNMLFPPAHNLQQELPFRNFWAAAHELAKNATLPSVSRHPAMQRGPQPRLRGGRQALVMQHGLRDTSEPRAQDSVALVGARGVNPDSVPPLPTEAGGDLVSPISNVDSAALNVSRCSSASSAGEHSDSDTSRTSYADAASRGRMHIPATPLQVSMSPGQDETSPHTGVAGRGWTSDNDAQPTLDSSMMSALDSARSVTGDSDAGATPVVDVGGFAPLSLAPTPLHGGAPSGPTQWLEQMKSITMTTATRAAGAVAGGRHDAPSDYSLSFRKALPVDRLLPELAHDVLADSGLIVSVAVAYVRNRDILRGIAARHRAEAARAPVHAMRVPVPNSSAPPAAPPALVRMQSGGSTLGFLDHSRAAAGASAPPSALSHPPSDAMAPMRSATEGSASETDTKLPERIITAVSVAVSWGGYLTCTAFAPAETGEYFEGYDETEECLAQALATAIVTAAEAPVAHDRSPLFREHVPEEFLVAGEGGVLELPEGGLTSAQLSAYSSRIPPRCSLPSASPFTGASSLDATLQQAVLKAVGRVSPPADSVLGKEMGWRHSNTGGSSDTVGGTPMDLSPPHRGVSGGGAQDSPAALGRPSPVDGVVSPKPTLSMQGQILSPLASSGAVFAAQPSAPPGLALDAAQHPGVVTGNSLGGGSAMQGRHLAATPGGASVASSGTAAALSTPRLGPQGEPIPQSERRSVMRGGNAEHLRQRKQHRSYLRAARRAIRAESAGGLGEARRGGGVYPPSAEESDHTDGSSPARAAAADSDTGNSQEGVLASLEVYSHEGGGGVAGDGVEVALASASSSTARDMHRQLHDASKRDLPAIAQSFLRTLLRKRQRVRPSGEHGQRLRSYSVLSAAEALRRRRGASVDISRPTPVRVGHPPLAAASINAPPPVGVLESALLGGATPPSKGGPRMRAASHSLGSSEDSASVQHSPALSGIMGQAVGVWTSSRTSPLIVASLPSAGVAAGAPARSNGHLPQNPMAANIDGSAHSPRPEPLTGQLLSPPMASQLPPHNPALKHAATFGGTSQTAKTARSIMGHMQLHTQTSFGFKSSPQGTSLVPEGFSLGDSASATPSGTSAGATSSSGGAPFKMQSRQLQRAVSATPLSGFAPPLAPSTGVRNASVGAEPLFPPIAAQGDAYYKQRNAPHVLAAQPQLLPGHLSPVLERGGAVAGGSPTDSDSHSLPASSSPSSQHPQAGHLAKFASDGHVAAAGSLFGGGGAGSFVTSFANFSDAPQLSAGPSIEDDAAVVVPVAPPSPDLPSFGHFGLRDGTSPFLGPAAPPSVAGLFSSGGSSAAVSASSRLGLSPLSSGVAVGGEPVRTKPPVPTASMAPGGGLKRVGKLGEGGLVGTGVRLTNDDTHSLRDVFIVAPVSPPLSGTQVRREDLSQRTAASLATPPRSAGDSLQEGCDSALGSPSGGGVAGMSQLARARSHHLDLSVAVYGPIPCFPDANSGTAGFQQVLFQAQAQALQLGSSMRQQRQQLQDSAPAMLSLGQAALAPSDSADPARQLTPSKPSRSTSMQSPRAAGGTGTMWGEGAHGSRSPRGEGGCTTPTQRDLAALQSTDTPPVDTDSQGTGTPVHLEGGGGGAAAQRPVQAPSILSALAAAAPKPADGSATVCSGGGDPYKQLHKASQPWRPSFMRGGSAAAAAAGPSKPESPVKLHSERAEKDADTPNLGPEPAHVPGMARADSYVALPQDLGEVEGGAGGVSGLGHAVRSTKGAHDTASCSGSDFDELYSRETSRGLTPRSGGGAGSGGPGGSAVPTAFSMMRASTFGHELHPQGTGTKQGRSSSSQRSARGGGLTAPSGGGLSLGLTRATHTMHAGLEAPHSRVLTDEPSPSRLSLRTSSSVADSRPSALGRMQPGHFAAGLATTANTPQAAGGAGQSGAMTHSGQYGAIERIDSPYMSLFLHFFDSQVEMFVQSWQQRQQRQQRAAAASALQP